MSMTFTLITLVYSTTIQSFKNCMFVEGRFGFSYLKGYAFILHNREREGARI